MRAFFLFLLCGLGSLHAAAPVVSNISASQRANSRLVDITYDVTADFPKVKVSLKVSSDGGSTYTIPATTLSGAIGAGVTIGKAKKITWDAGKDWSGQYSSQMRFKVIADDGNSAPTISDIAAQTINEGGDTGAVAFTVGDAQTAASSLTLSGSSSNTTLVPNANIVFGGSGANRTVTVTPTSSQTGTATITVTVSDGSLTSSDTFLLTVNPAVSMGMALIPQGAYKMGDSLDGSSDAPTCTVTLDAFYIGKYEVTKAKWDEVRTWGLSNGYTDLAAGSGKASNHPVESITWYMMVKWCNARSQKEGLTPVYYTDDAQTTIYKTGSVDVTNAQVKWTANGYRLPTEAEWEKAARGGLLGKRFPWGDTISHSQANYNAGSGDIFYSSGLADFHPTYAKGSMPYTSPIGAFAANGYGLYDMVGNVEEWCWDHDGTYAAGSQNNPRGSTSGSGRVHRGGGWDSIADICRVANRGYGNPAGSYFDLGFRVARSSAPEDGNSAPTISDIAAQSISQERNTGAIAFTIGDAQTAAGSLTLSASSNNTTLVPNANIVFGGSGANRTVTVTPASSLSGTATITVTVGDGSLTISDNFVLTVNSSPSENSAPTISDIAAQSISQGSNTGAIAFTISDAQTAVGSLTLSGSSNNTTLVPNANIAFGGSGANRTVTVTPASGQSGTATITVTVRDGTLTRSDTFVLTVNAAPANTAPTISDIADQTIIQGPATATAALAFMIGDTQTAPDSLTLSASSSYTTLVPNEDIYFGGSGANRTVTVIPASGQIGTATITVTVSDGSLTSSDAFLLTVDSVPAGMSLILESSFTMGNWLAEDTDITDAPIRTVYLHNFYMGKCEVTKAEWDEVRTWGLSNGYTDLAAGSGKASNHPVLSISWYDMVKWCNARSQKEGLTPVYYTDDAQTTIYKTGSVDVTNAQVKWTANGYRLPTEAEWEKAARGFGSHRFSRGETISHSQANYYASSSYSYDSSGSVNNYHPTYATGSTPYTSPVGEFDANGYGLYDMAGNVWECCWDWYGTYAAGAQTNPSGSTSGSGRVMRGGSWNGNANDCRVAKRNFILLTRSYGNIGFRVVRSSAP